MSDIVVSNLPVLVDIASVGVQGAQGLQGLQGVQGPVGPQGPQGLPGAAVGIGEAPTDGTIYGRKGNTATWHNVLGLATGGTVTGPVTFSGTVTLPTTTTGPFLPLVAGVHSIAESGAVGDGVADDQPPIQAWLNSMSATYGACEVLLPPGKWYYIHAAPLYVPPHVTIRGAYSARDNQMAGGGATLFSGGGFYIDPALPAGIILSASTTLRQVKVFRKGMTANANNTVAAADYATWTAEGVYKKTTALVGVGVTTIPLTDTTGITVGMAVTGPGGFSPIGTTWPQYSTVTTVTAGVSVTVSVGGNVAIPSGAYLRFGTSIGVIVSRNCGGVVVDEVQVIGFRTGIQTFPGEFAISRAFGDCITNLECVTGADNGIVRDCEWLPLYGMPVSTNFVRAGDAVFMHDCAGPAFHGCYSIGWQTNWHFENASAWCYGCGGETPTNVGPGTVNWLLRGGSQMSLFDCHAQTGGIGFHLDGTNQFQLSACSSSNAQTTTANNTAHFLIENTISAPAMSGSLIAPWSSGGYPNKVPIVYGSGTITGITVTDAFMVDITTPSPSVPFVQGTAPNPLNPGTYPGAVYAGSRTNGGTTTIPHYWHGVVMDSSLNPIPAHTIQLPAFPADRQAIDLWFNVAVTALTYTTTDGAAIGNYDSPGAGEQVQLVYQAAQNKWFVGGAGVGEFLPLAGGVVTGATTFNAAVTHAAGGINFGSQLAAGATDLSKHIALYGTNYGLSITAASINFIIAGVVNAVLTGNGITTTNNVRAGDATHNAIVLTAAATTAGTSTIGVGGTGGIQINVPTLGFNKVPVATPMTGWGTSTGGARAAITVSSTLAQVAAGLAQLLTDLQAYGLLGT